jgi:hypothetical protein
MPILLLGLIFAHWFPPPSPAESAAEVATFYQQHTNGIRVGSLLVALAGTLMAPFAAVLAMQIKRIARGGLALAYVELVMAALWVAGIVIPATLFMAAAFNPERSPDVTQALHVAGWLPFIAMVFPLIAVHISIAAATFLDERSDPVFPRWVGYLNVWMALLLMPGVLALFFKTGALAWNGLLTFWLAATAEGSFYIIMCMMLRRAVSHQEREEQGTSRTAQPA